MTDTIQINDIVRKATPEEQAQIELIQSAPPIDYGQAS